MITPLLSIIIPTHNSEQVINRCIHSLTSQSFPRDKFEIIIVDDGSTDKSVEAAKSAGADYVIETTPCSAGNARNNGVKNSKGNFLAFIDSDCEAKDGWIKTIVTELKTTDAVCGPIENGNPQSLVAWAEYFLEFGGHHEFNKRAFVRFSSSCNAAYTKKVFLKVGGFADLRAFEDVLLGQSLKQVRVDTLFVPGIRILHLCRTELNKVSSNMKLLGKYFVRSRIEDPSLPYALILKSRQLIPIIFLGKIFKSTIYAIQAKKLGIFLRAFSFVVSCDVSFCRGIWDELTQTKIIHNY